VPARAAFVRVGLAAPRPEFQAAGAAAALPSGITPHDTRTPMTSLEEVRARFARDQGLPFADSLTEPSILDALDEHGVQYRDRLFGPVTTIWGFLSQVLSEDHSCRDAVSRIIAHRAAAGLKPCS